MRNILFVFACLVLAACGDNRPPPFANVDVSGAQLGSALAGFRDHHGAPATLADFRGRVLVVFFGYTYCPDVCPTTLARLAQVMKGLGDDARRVQVVFVTLDPQRDTARQLAGYVPWFDASFVGFYADGATTEAAARAFGVFHARHGDAAAYTIDHSAGAYVFDPAGRIRLYVRDDASVEAIVGDLRRLLAGA